MQKPLRDIAGHLKNIILSEIPETYTIKPIFTSISDKESIRNGVIAYRDFLYRFYDYLIINGDLYDKPKKIAHPFSDHVSLSANYPFLKNIENVLISIGINGNFNKNRDLLTLDGAQFRADLAKIPTIKVIECLRCLTDNGFCIFGVNLTENKVNLSDIKTLEISYPDNPAVSTGIKVMAKAKEEFESTDIYGIFLRCDYRMIADEEIELICFLKDMTKLLPLENQEFILKLHKKYLDNGLQCTFDFSVAKFSSGIGLICKQREVYD